MYDDFQNHLNQAIQMCDDYSTVSPDSDKIEMIWFTPSQLKRYTQYCINQSKNKSNKPLKTKHNASNPKK